MKKYAIMREHEYLHDLIPNEDYSHSARGGTMSNHSPHSGAEFNPLFLPEEHYFDPITVKGMLPTLIDSIRFGNYSISELSIKITEDK